MKKRYMPGQILGNVLRLTLLFMVVLLCGNLDGVSEAVPEKMNFQGFVTDSSGNPVDGTGTFVFTIYDAETAGNSLWTETLTVGLSKGFYNVVLGSVTALTLPFDIPYFLGIKIGTDPEISPRKPLTTSGYAFRAENSNDSWRLVGNSGTTTTAGKNFLGTTDDVALEIKVNNVRALRIEPNATSPNIIGGYRQNTVTGPGSTISGGGANSFENQVTGNYGTVGGGKGNIAGPLATVGGGSSNGALKGSSTVGGGSSNIANAINATVPGGQLNSALGEYSFAAGRRAKANEDGAFVWGDSTTVDIASFGINTFTAQASGGVKFVSPNIIMAPEGTTVPFVGTTDDRALEIKVNNVRALRIEPNATSPNIIGGQRLNTVTGPGATIGGGGDNSFPNQVTGNYGTVSGGRNNIAGPFGTVGGGSSNGALKGSSTVAGGSSNIADAINATVPGGQLNFAKGEYSFAAGRRAKANENGAFVWGDSTSSDITSFGINTFTARASGGVKFFSDSSATVGVSLAANGNSWGVISDRNVKANIVRANSRNILSRLVEVPISTWNLKSQDPSIRHIGPMAQDFYAAFNVGENDKYITTVDADGVALAAIQGLHQIVQEKEEQIANLETRLAALEQRVEDNVGQAGVFPREFSPNWLVFGGLALLGFAFVRRDSGRIQKS